MATFSNAGRGPLNSPGPHSYHSNAKSTNPNPSYSYEGYVFTPIDYDPHENWWISARPTKTLASQDDLIDQVIKQVESGRTAMQDLFGSRVNDTKREMITKLIKEKNSNDLGFKCDLAAIRLERDYVRDEEPDDGKKSIRRYHSKHKDTKRRRRRTVLVYVVLRWPIVSKPDDARVDVSTSAGQNFGINTTGRGSRPPEKSVSRTPPITPTGSTPSRYIPPSYQDTHPKSNGSSLDLQASNWRDCRENQCPSSRPLPVRYFSETLGTPRSGSLPMLSSSVTVPSSTWTVTSATTPDDYFQAGQLARSHIAQDGYRLAPTTVWPEKPTTARATKNGNSIESEYKQQQTTRPQQTTQVMTLGRPYFSVSRSTQTNVTIADHREDGRHEVSNDPKGDTYNVARVNVARHALGAEDESLPSLTTSDDDMTSTDVSTDDSDSSLTSQTMKAKAPSIFERKPSWMDNMVPVIPPSAAQETHVEAIRDKTQSALAITEDYLPSSTSKYNIKAQATCKDDQIEPREADEKPFNSDKSSPRLAKEEVHGVECYPDLSKGMASSSQNQPAIDHSEQVLEHNLGGNTEGVRCSSPSLSRQGPYERQRPADSHLAQLHQPTKPPQGLVKTSDRSNVLGNGHADGKRLSPSLDKPRSYERLRPKTPSPTSVPEPTGIRKVFGVKTEKDVKGAPRKQVKFSEPLASSLSNNDIPYQDSLTPAPQSAPVSPLTELPHTTNRVPTRPPLHRQSNSAPVQYSNSKGSSSFTVTETSPQSSRSKASEVDSFDGAVDKGDDSSDIWDSDGSSGHEQKSSDHQWTRGFPPLHARMSWYSKCQSSENEDTKEHRRIAPQSDRAGSE